MSLPVYFVQPPGLPQPAGKCCLCGWHAAHDGALVSPLNPEAANVLVFDDRNALPTFLPSIIDEILDAKKEIGAELILLDFERDPTPTSLSFVKSLAAKCAVAAPEAYCTNCPAEPIFCYCPAKETFDTFCRRITHPKAWLELYPIDMEIIYPFPGAYAEKTSQAVFSDILRCNYTARSTQDGLILHLYDSPESFLQRATILVPQLKAAVGLTHELLHFGIKSGIKEAAVSS